jgi:hypothetical protein
MKTTRPAIAKTPNVTPRPMPTLADVERLLELPVAVADVAAGFVAVGVVDVPTELNI